MLYHKRIWIKLGLWIRVWLTSYDHFQAKEVNRLEQEMICLKQKIIRTNKRTTTLILKINYRQNTKRIFFEIRFSCVI